MAQQGAESYQENELSQLFASFNPLTDEASGSIALPNEAILTRDWTCTAVARVITERPVVESHFSPLMLRLWEVQPSTKISQVERNTFLIEFHSEEEMDDILHREPWTYRNDIVSLHRVTNQNEVRDSATRPVELWTQMHNVPLELRTEGGISFLANRLEPVLTEVRQGSIKGNPFYSVKVPYQGHENGTGMASAAGAIVIHDLLDDTVNTPNNKRLRAASPKSPP